MTGMTLANLYLVFATAGKMLLIWSPCLIGYAAIAYLINRARS